MPQLCVQDTEEAQKLVMWTGKVKHRLKTAEGASTVDLFNVSALVPEELMEQMPPTLFVSALAGRVTIALLLSKKFSALMQCWYHQRTQDGDHPYERLLPS